MIMICGTEYFEFESHPSMGVIRFAGVVSIFPHPEI